MTWSFQQERCTGLHAWRKRKEKERKKDRNKERGRAKAQMIQICHVMLLLNILHIPNMHFPHSQCCYAGSQMIDWSKKTSNTTLISWSIPWTDLLKQVHMLPHKDTSCRSNFLPHPVTVYWHRANQSPGWPYNARRLAGKSANFYVTGMPWPGKIPMVQERIRPLIFRSWP